MYFYLKALKIVIIFKLIILILFFAPTAYAELKIDSVYPTLGELGQNLAVTMIGDGFDARTRVSIRLRFDDYLETAMIEAVPAEVGSGALAALSSNPDAGAAGNTAAGSEGVFYVVNARGNVFQGVPTTLAEFDTIIQRLDKQGSIEENVIFVNRDFSFAIDDMLAAQNSYGTGGTSYGLFDNDEEMALNLGFRGFRRGYDFYKSDWKYLNDPTMRGGLNGGKVDGLLVSTLR